MAYLSKSDAINKLTNGFLDNDSFALYYSDNNHNLNTIYYTNAAKTTLLPAGNYCLPTNYRTLYITINSNGKLTQLPELLFATEPDSTFVDDTIFSQVSNSRERGWGENCSMNGYLLTDTKANVPNFGQSNKQWVCNTGFRNVSNINDMDLSAMAGYDLLFYVGGFGDYYQFNDPFASTFFVHLKQNLYRNSILTDGIHTKIYFFKPDYLFAKQSINQTTFFKRSLALSTLKNKRGGNKFYSIIEKYAHDVLQYDKTTVRTSTRKNRGVDYEFFSTDANVTTTAQIGHGYATTSWVLDRTKGIYFDQPYTILSAFQTAFGYAYNKSDDHNVKMTAMFRSMYLGDFTSTFTTIANGVSYSVSYATANPYQWRCTFNSGNGSPNQPCNAFVDALKGGSTGDLPTKVAWWFWDLEEYWVLQADEIGFKGLLESFKNAKTYVTTNSLSNIDTKIVPYAYGVYFTNGEFKDSGGNDVNPSNYTSSDYYYDYHNYYVNSSITKDSLLKGYNKAYYSYAEYFNQSHITNYLNNYNSKWFFYRMLHHYDISNKLIAERLGANHQVAIASFMFNMYETVPGVTMSKMRKAIRSNGEVRGAKPDISPDFWQSLAAWSFGYADGCYNWNSGDFFLEYYQDLDFPDTYPGSSTTYEPEKFKNDFAGADWFYSTMVHLYQNRDILEANTDWQYSSQKKADNTFTSGTENYPVTSYAFQRPLIVHKFSSNGLEALVMAINPFNNGYTKTTATIDLYGGYPFTIDMWGTYTTIMRVKVSSIPPAP